MTITFPAERTGDGAQITSYSVTRYDGYTNAPAGSISGSCSAGSTIVSCTDVPGAGSWRYADAPTYGSNWVGGESTESAPVLIAGATGLSPAGGVVGSSAQIAVHGFLPSKALTVTVGGAVATIDSGGATDPDGNSVVTFTIPPLSGGAEEVVVSDGTDSATSNTNFMVNPAVSLSTSSGSIGTTGVTLTGTGYISGKTVTASFAGSPLTLTPAEPTVNPTGTWSATFTVPIVPNGPQVVAADDAGGASAATGFTVTGSVSPPVSATATGLNPISGAAGIGVTISAQGFPADQALTVVVDGANATITAGGTTDTHGSTTLTFTVPSVPSGAQKVVVSDGTVSATSDTDFTVTAGTPTTTTGPIVVSGCVVAPKADCSGANLTGANFAGANLAGANLAGANLAGANLAGANLTGANLTGANLAGATLTGTNLSGVIWGRTTCPDGTVSDKDDGTCVNSLG